MCTKVDLVSDTVMSQMTLWLSFVGSVIKSWELGIPTMKRGEITLFHCQPKYAHGKKGLPPKVPPNATVNYEIELFSWRGM